LIRRVAPFVLAFSQADPFHASLAAQAELCARARSPGCPWWKDAQLRRISQYTLLELWYAKPNAASQCGRSAQSSAFDPRLPPDVPAAEAKSEKTSAQRRRPDRPALSIGDRTCFAQLAAGIILPRGLQLISRWLPLVLDGFVLWFFWLGTNTPQKSSIVMRR